MSSQALARRVVVVVDVRLACVVLDLVIGVVVVPVDQWGVVVLVRVVVPAMLELVEQSAAVMVSDVVVVVRVHLGWMSVLLLASLVTHRRLRRRSSVGVGHRSFLLAVLL
jgi:hypothetical protein